MSQIIIKLITWYQKYLSRDSGIFKSKTPVCVFYPTCSEYTKQAIVKYGLGKGMVLGIKRIARCHPWHKGDNFDPLP